jgi:hypothetical protein
VKLTTHLYLPILYAFYYRPLQSLVKKKGTVSELGIAPDSLTNFGIRQR